MESQRGQAAAEYVAMLGVAATLLLTGAAVAKPDLARAVVAQVKTGLCLVGGDICRSSDAEAAGLDPCVVSADARSRRTGLTLLFLRAGDESAVVVERRSDGTVALARVEGKDLGGDASFGVPLGPAGKVDAGGEVALRWRSGKVWEFPDAAAFERVFQRHGLRPGAAAGGLHGLLDRVAPTATFLEGGANLSADLSGSLFGGNVRMRERSLGQTLGRRVSGDETTWFLDATGFAPRMLGAVARGVRAWTLEIGVRDGEPRRLVLRGRREGTRSEEVIARLDLAEPGNRAAARDLLGLRPPWTPMELARLATIGRHVLAAGTVERHVYRASEMRDRDWTLGAGGAGIDHVRAVTRRELVEATLHGPGGRVIRRADCLASPRAGV